MLRGLLFTLTEPVKCYPNGIWNGVILQVFCLLLRLLDCCEVFHDVFGLDVPQTPEDENSHGLKGKSCQAKVVLICHSYLLF